VKKSLRSACVALATALLLAACGSAGVSGGGGTDGTPSASSSVGAQAGPGTTPSVVPDTVTYSSLVELCKNIVDDKSYLPDLPGVTADGLGGKPYAAADADLATLRRAVPYGAMQDYVNGGPPARAAIAESDRAYILGDVAPTRNANFPKMMETLSGKDDAFNACERAAKLFSQADTAQVEVLPAGTTFAGLVYKNDYSSPGYSCSFYSPPQGVRVLSWNRPEGETTGDQKNLPTIKYAVDYRMLVVDKCPVSQDEAAKFGGNLLAKPTPSASASQPAGTNNDSNQNQNNPSGGNTGGAGGSKPGDDCGSSCNPNGSNTKGPGGGGSTGPAPGPSGSGPGGGNTCSPGDCGGGTGTPTPTPTKTTTPKPSPTPTPTRTPTPTPTPTKTPTPTPTPSDSCTGYPVPQECKGSPPPWTG
jgi:hypothetical protein